MRQMHIPQISQKEYRKTLTFQCRKISSISYIYVHMKLTSKFLSLAQNNDSIIIIKIFIVA